MLVSYKWLNEFVDLSGVSPAELAEKITRSGIEVEHVTDLSKGIKKVVVGYVEECEPHPNADTLNVCKVDVGEEELVQIICGAPNVGKGQKVPVARVGARLPGGVKIKRAKLRGEVSEGMICALDELGFDSKVVPKAFDDGIYVMEEDAEVGTDALSYINLDDTVLELDILPNSAHSMNMIGVAYEVAAILDRPIKLPAVDLEESDEETSEAVAVKVDVPEDVLYYGARIVSDLKIAPSPRWMQTRLMAEGIRPINNVVDITNYVLLEYGQPLHAFDYDRLGSEEILVRRAENNEKIVTLDSTVRELDNTDLVITNGEKPVAVAGVMGGEETEVTEDTQTVLLEAAVFDSISIRKTAGRLQLRTDASSRYERGIDRNRVAGAADRAAQLMAEIAGGKIKKGIVEAGEREIAPTVIKMSAARISRVLGIDLKDEEITGTLKRLNLDAEIKDGELTVSAPPRRFDLNIPEDIIEEVGRIYGYDSIPETLPEGETTAGALTDHQKKRRQAARVLEGAGLFQAVTYSLTHPDHVYDYVMQDKESLIPVRLTMPMSSEREVLRQSILPELINAASYHKNRQMPDVRLFEMGRVFLNTEEAIETQPEEREHLAGIMSGNLQPAGWQSPAVKVDFFTVKGILEELFAECGIEDEVVFRSVKRDGMHPGRTADMYVNEELIGFAGELHPLVEKGNDLPETYVFEMDLSCIFNAAQKPVYYSELPKYPTVTRDIALVVDEDVQAGELSGLIRETGGKTLQNVNVFDIYQGEHMETGKKSVAFSLTYYDEEKTLTDEEVGRIHDHILETLEREYGAVLRG